MKNQWFSKTAPHVAEFSKLTSEPDNYAKLIAVRVGDEPRIIRLTSNGRYPAQKPLAERTAS